MKILIFFFSGLLLSQNLTKFTIDSQIQKIATTALENQLKNYDAKSGSVLVMEVATGKVKSLVNLEIDENGNYQNAKKNYILNDYTEPGSLFMPVSLLMAIEKGYINKDTKVETQGIWDYEGAKIYDATSGNFSLSDILSKSSNIAIAKIITENYQKNPQDYYQQLKDWKFLEKPYDETKNNAKPEIILPENKNWTKSSLASASYGYSMKLSALQIANFYNAIANKGKMLKPSFVEGENTEILIDKMASEQSIQILTDALTKSVEDGTIKTDVDKYLKVSGKSGTTRLEYWKPGPTKYQASFVGFFPAQKPRYTCIVIIREPNIVKGYFGATVSVPVFKEIAGKILEN